MSQNAVAEVRVVLYNVGDAACSARCSAYAYESLRLELSEESLLNGFLECRCSCDRSVLCIVSRPESLDGIHYR